MNKVDDEDKYVVRFQSINPDSDVYWDKDDLFISELRKKYEIDLKALTLDDLKILVCELDRRFVQLWIKVKFEREQKLINYSPLSRKQRIHEIYTTFKLRWKQIRWKARRFMGLC